MDKNEFIQRAAIEIYSNRGEIDMSTSWKRAVSLYEEGNAKGYFLSEDKTPSGYKTHPTYTPPAYPRNMHVNGVIEQDLDAPF